MAQQWAALISLGPSGTQVPCPVLPPSPFTSRRPCPLLLSGEVHNRNSLSHKTRLACSQGACPPPLGGEQRQASALDFLQWYQSRNVTSGRRIEISRLFRQSADVIFFVCSLFYPESRSDYTHCHFQGPSLRLKQ